MRLPRLAAARCLRLFCWSLVGAGHLAVARAALPPERVMIFVVDGLRPDVISAENTPTLDRLRREGVNYLNAHSAFPTVTRVNAPVIVTGAHPQRTGITSNTLFERRINGGNPFNTGDAANLWPFAEVRGGRMVQAPTLGEMLTGAGLAYLAISSGSTGQAILLNSEVKRETGAVINGAFEGGRRTAYPETTNVVVRARFGLKPMDEKADNLEWTERVLREYVLTDIAPVVILDWITEPDHTQHKEGVGAPATLAAIRRADESIGKTLALLEKDGRLEHTAIIVTADHGFAAHEEGVAVTDAVVKAKLKQTPVSRDVVITADSHSVQFFVDQRDPKKIRPLVEWLQQQPWVDAVFVDRDPPPPLKPLRGARIAVEGWLPGTFSLQAIHLAPPEGRPDVVVTLPWRSERNAFGYPGRQTIMQAKSGPITSNASGHGGLSPWVVRTPLILWGGCFKPRTVIHAPAGNVDITPTVLALLGVKTVTEFDGRVLDEAFVGGTDEAKVPARREIFEVSNGRGFSAALQISSVGRYRYIDQAWRLERR